MPSRSINLEFRTQFDWYDHRLKWPAECLNETLEKIPNFVKSEWMNVLWNPISVLENIGSADKPKYEKTIRIGQVSFVKSAFTWYKDRDGTRC